MKKLAKFLVDKRLWLFVGTLIVTVICLVLMNFVKVNQDMTQYLPKDSNMRLGLEIMDKEFPAVESNEGLKLMFEGLTYKQKQLVKEKIEAYPGVQSVTYDLESDAHNSGEYTLYIVTSEYKDLDQLSVMAENMLDYFDNHYTVYAYYGNPMYNVLDVLLPLAMSIFMVALVIFCKAYIEVFLLLVSIGVSILINMGTNIIFPSISDMTLSIAAVLQLALSIDYSIMLFHRYEQEKIRLAERPNNVLALKRAIKNAFSSICSSAVTTIVGLLVLLLMSFTIGADMGLVMAKGILCSLICVFTVMPTMLLWCDKLLLTTNKKYLREQRLLKKRQKKTTRRTRKSMLDKILNAIGKFAYRGRYFVLVLGILLFVGAAILQSYASISYSYTDHSKVLEVFPVKDTLVLVYDNFDEDKITALTAKLSEDENVTSVQSYPTTLGAEMNSAELADVAGIDKSFIEILFYVRERGMETEGMSVQTFINFLTSDAVMGNEMFAGQMDEASVAQLSQLQTLVNAIAADEAYDAESLAAMLGVDVSMVRGIFLLSLKSKMTVTEFIDTALVLSSSFSQMLSPEQLDGLKMMDQVADLVKENRMLTPAELLEVFPFETEAFNENALQLLYVMHAASQADMSEIRVSLYDFFAFIAEDIVPNELFSEYFDEGMKQQIVAAKQVMEDGKDQLVGEEYSRMIITLDYQLESKEMYDFYKMLEQELEEKFDGVYYLVGTSAMSNELDKTFELEYLIISIITAVAIFIVVCLTFKKFSVSLILVSIIECAVFITMSTMVLANSAMYFIALIIVQCILMGSMVDYGILFTNYYLEVRKEYAVEEALPEVLKRSIRAIATSAVILILITFSCGIIMEGAVSSILTTLGIGSTSALILVIFVLPSLLAIFDKCIIKKKKETEVCEQMKMQIK